MKALVTGASGFVGSHIVQALLARGDQVVALFHGVNSLATSHPNLSYAVGDVINMPLMHSLIQREGVDEIYHVAAVATVNFANSNPYETFESNVHGTYSMLEAATKAGAKRVVVASSDKAYGTPVFLPMTESHPLNAKAPYDVSKACADIIARTWRRPGLVVAVTRCSNIYGPGDFNRSRAVPGFMADIVAGKAPVVRSDGSPTRDYIYIDDVVSGYLALMDELRLGPNARDIMAAKDDKWGAFNFGTGVPTSVKTLIEQVMAITGSNLAPVYEGTEKPSIQDQYLSSVKAKALLGWEPKVDLQEGLEKTYRWFMSHGAKA